MSKPILFRDVLNPLLRKTPGHGLRLISESIPLFKNPESGREEPMEGEGPLTPDTVDGIYREYISMLPIHTFGAQYSLDSIVYDVSVYHYYDRNRDTVFRLDPLGVRDTRRDERKRRISDSEVRIYGGVLFD